MNAPAIPRAPSLSNLDPVLPKLACPDSGEALVRQGSELVTGSGRHRYRIDELGIPLFAEQFCSPEALVQQKHYDKIADAYAENLEYPHTMAYMEYLDDELREIMDIDRLGDCVELCCGKGEAMTLFADAMDGCVGVDVSTSMLHKGRRSLDQQHLHFVQGDATRLPLVDEAFDTVVILGGIHHVPDRQALFRQAYRVLRPGGTFIWREPVSDFWLWRALRALIYRISPILDHDTERPLTYEETVPVLEEAGFELEEWRTCGFIGFCLLMNSDVLYFNRLFRFIPGIRAITVGFTRFDRWCTNLPGLRRAGLQVVGRAVKPEERHAK